MMATAERLLLEADGRPLRFSDVFEAAGVSRGSAYRIYMGIDDLIQDLAAAWVNNFVEFLESAEPASTPQDWSEVSDFIVQKAADYWGLTAATMRVLPRIRSYEPSSYREAIHALSEVNARLFDRYVVVPDVSDWLAKMAFYARICDITFGDAVRVEGRISEQRVEEAQALCCTYLSFHLPAALPLRDPAEA
ncbi:MAG: TetR/AcrR family transcriptional regulator [Woeseiaceae bacterium]|jgi:AcrR family transcriptional regulator